MLSPAFIIFVSISLFGVVVVFMSAGLFGVWVGLELGFFGFLPVLNGKTVGENESAVKYFIVQTVGSGIIVIRFLFINSSGYLELATDLVGLSVDFLILVGFMVKLGVFPLHF